ncbi:MAG: YCF48-related protein [candidate division WOR-3 bacterium]
MEHNVSVVTAVVLVFALSAFAQVAGPEDMVKGMAFVREPSGVHYDSPEARVSLEKLKSSVKPNWVVIVPVWWQRDTGLSVSEVYFWPDSSPSDTELRQVIMQAHNSGLKVFLKPEVRCSTRVWIGRHHPSFYWFQSYFQFITHYAQLAESTGCELFSVGCALDSAADDTLEQNWWRNIIRNVRERYSGPVTYSADWRTYRNIGFWDSLDYIGINAYFPVWDITTGVELDSVSAFSEMWKRRWVPQIDSFWRGLGYATPKPVIFTEIGYRSVMGACLYPWDETMYSSFNEYEQRCCYIAALHSLLGRPWFAGWFWHCWTTDTLQGGYGDLGYTPKGKMAQEVLRRYNSTISSHKGFCFPSTYDYTYFYPDAYYALESLVAHNANWVAVNARWIMADTGANYDTIAPYHGHSPTDSSIRAVIDSAHSLGLNVSLCCYISCFTPVWCGWHNPGGNTNWFRDESVYVSHYAPIAEQESVEMFTIGLELDRAIDDSEEVGMWRKMVIPAVRRVYSGPLVYGSTAVGGRSPYYWFWDPLDLCGIHAYFQLFPEKQYHGDYPDDTMVDQRPDTHDLRTNQWGLGWQDCWIPRLESLSETIEKPILFTEIGYRSLDSIAAHPAYDYRYGWRNPYAIAPPATQRNLRSVCFPMDTLIGYVVGDVGTILKTTNSGSTWIACASGTSNHLHSVDFPTRDTGYAVGENGVILKTTNGWESYENIGVPGMTLSYYSVCFPENPSIGYVVGDSGVILKTTNGGSSWQRFFCILPSGDTLRVRLRSVCLVREINVVPASIGYIVGESGTVLKTTNAGESWYKLTVPVSANLNGVDFISPDTGFVCGDWNVFLKTTNGGTSWDTFRFRPYEGRVEFYSVCVPEYDSARFVVGTGGVILRAGNDWCFDGSRQLGPTYNALHSVQFRVVEKKPGYYDLVGFAVGDSGTILKASTGGRMIVDFNEQANCYEAAFRAFWKDQNNPSPFPWFYGFHFWRWFLHPEPLDIEHEVQIDDATPQQKRAGEIVRKWFNWSR